MGSFGGGMASAPLSNDPDFELLVSCAIGSGTPNSEAIVDAFSAANVDVFRKDTLLENWICTDALDQFTFDSTGGLRYLSSRIWDHRVVLTDGTVRIYTPATPSVADSDASPPTREQ